MCGAIDCRQCGPAQGYKYPMVEGNKVVANVTQKDSYDFDEDLKNLAFKRSLLREHFSDVIAIICDRSLEPEDALEQARKHIYDMGIDY